MDESGDVSGESWEGGIADQGKEHEVMGIWLGGKNIQKIKSKVDYVKSEYQIIFQKNWKALSEDLFPIWIVLNPNFCLSDLYEVSLIPKKIEPLNFSQSFKSLHTFTLFFFLFATWFVLFKWSTFALFFLQ